MNIRYREGDFVAVHVSPAWKDASNYIFHVYTGCEDGRNTWEQIWGGKSKTDGLVKVCCVPFFARNLALGDVVEIDDTGILLRVIEQSGHVTFRAFISGVSTADIGHSLVRDIKLLDPTVVVEWYSERLVGASAANELSAQRIADYLHSRESLGDLEYETARDSV